MTVTIKAKALEAFVADIFASAGCSTDEGGRIGRYLVSANLSGHDSHGVVRVPRYATQKKNGTVRGRRHGRRRGRHAGDRRGRRQVRLRPDRDAAGRRRSASTSAASNGLSAVTLRNAGHVGRVGDWAEMAAEAGLVSIHFVNASGSVLVAPFGGVAAALLDRALLRRRAAAGPGPAGARLRHLGRGRGQGAGGEPGRQEGARRRADRPRRQAEQPTRTCSTATTRRPGRATTARAPAPSAPSATTRARASPSCASCWAAR